MRHEFDIFVCTTIIENGLDIPLANTMIIENAERYGLSELYQLRGRVGRSNRRAYAYLLVPPDTELTEIARKRLAALKEFSDLGAGFKIAALDLELRGAGNLLGGEQHGHINSVGFDMYVRLLEETVRELQGRRSRPGDPFRAQSRPRHPHSARVHRRRKPAAARLPADRQCRRRRRPRPCRKGTGGSIWPGSGGRAQPACSTPALKTLAEQIGIEAVDRRHNLLNIKFHAETRVDPARLMDMVAKTRGAQFTPAGVLLLPLDGQTAAGESCDSWRKVRVQLNGQPTGKIEGLRTYVS